MGTLTTQAMEGLKARVKSAYGYSDATAYAHIGLSSMNGKTDDSGELVRVADFKTMLVYAQQHHIGRLTYWSVNRDRPAAPVPTVTPAVACRSSRTTTSRSSPSTRAEGTNP